MPIKILMPALSPTMTEGTLAKWLLQEGAQVASGDVLAEIETDKATMEFEAVDEGTLAKIVVPEGTQGVAVNQVIAVLLEEGEDVSAVEEVLAGTSSAPPPAAEPVSAEAPVASPPSTAASTPAPARSNGQGRLFASPLARRMASQAGLDLAQLTGSGPQGRIVKRDIEQALASGLPAKIAAPGPAPAVPALVQPSGPGPRALADLLGVTYRLEPLTNIRKTIARRLTEAKQTVPHFYLTVDCEIDELLKIRKQLNARDEGFKLSVNDFIIRAVALALKKVPAANASFSDEGLLYYEHADIAVAVATPNGLITPVVRAAESKGLAAISAEMKDLAARARDGKLKPEEYQGGGFSLSNLGMYGIKEFAAIINPPQGCILAVGAGEQRPVVKNGNLAVATVMSATLSVDHRVVDGALGAEFLAAFKSLIQDPLAMLL